jgi:predicted AAA+ superfamily ATPase
MIARIRQMSVQVVKFTAIITTMTKYQPIKRLLGSKIEKNPKSTLLLGPRQTGKSTLLSSLGPDLTINLAREDEYLRHVTDLGLLESQILASQASFVFLDEVQRLPELLNTTQAIIDESKFKGEPIRFLLSGSSARKLKRGKANLLPGRVLVYEMGGLCAKELSYQVDTNRALCYGFLPEPYFETDNKVTEKLLESYSAVYLKEEIQAESILRNIQGFARFLNVLAISSGQLLDLSKTSSKAKVSRTSSARFVEILEDTLIAQRIDSFNEIEDADLVKHPKLYFFDIGVLNGLLQNFNASGDRRGFLFEHLVYSQIRNSCFATDTSSKIHFFRTRHGLEVDFIVTLRNEVWALEVKCGRAEDISPFELQGLKAFRKYFPKVSRTMLITEKGRKRQVEGILICNWLDMLQEMKL